ncbi:TRAP transporter small permease [Pseudohoeflea coraliihabitans]|uniref:TRAP transporter small permease protein n=1 Tax=Pseudohoeflea coraliihabitans TaxID=2860393 RepID=A0ABS6WK54_9HYPH|nr:TRAP transporter small permease subunit [Pseudohoeflea sp. DP4N28-3]MBW3096033.1 TRAP transporter small permease subunit [Pseudohoeflea sp. DP4N28-3]
MNKSFGFAVRLVSVSLFVAMFFAVFLQVILRYFLGLSVGAAVEIALNSFVFGAWWAIIWHLSLREHVNFDVVYSRLPERGQIICRIVSGIVVAGLLLSALPAAIRYVEVMGRITTGVLKMPLSWVYSIFVVFLVVVSFRFAYESLLAMRKLFRRGENAS